MLSLNTILEILLFSQSPVQIRASIVCQLLSYPTTTHDTKVNT